MLWRSLHRCPDAMAPLPTSHWRCPVSRVALVAKGLDFVPALGGPLLRHCRHCGRVTVTSPWHRRYGIVIALTINNFAVASPSHCHRAAVVLMQRQPMLGAGARHRRSRPCWPTCCPFSRLRCHCVVDAPSLSRRFDHRHRHGPHVALLSCHCGHVTCVAVAPMLSRSCRSNIAAVVVT